MPTLRFTLIGEGPSDDALLPIVERLLTQPSVGRLPGIDVASTFVSARSLGSGLSLTDRILATARDHPSNLIFVHHDADGQNPDIQATVIRQATGEARLRMEDLPPVIPVVPVREMEAWLLPHTSAIRRAARNPHGTMPLALPRGRQIERHPDPKMALDQALQQASGLAGRRHRRLDDIRPIDVARWIDDISPLLAFPSFRALRDEIDRVIAEQEWPERL